MSEAKQNPGYVDDEYLKRLAETLQALKQQTYDLMRVAPGHHVLDVGCGPATDTIPLARVVGASGRVVGIDYDGEMIALANQKAREAGVASYTSHEQCSAEDLPFDDNSFDSCRSERVFQHLENPAQALQEIIRVSKPGAWIVIFDPDWTTFSIDTPYLETEWKLRKVMRDRNHSGTIGRQLYRLMRQAQLESVSVQGLFWPVTDYNSWNYLAVANQDLQVALEQGLLTEDEVEQFDSHLRERSEQGLFFAYGVGILASGQKPKISS